MNSRARQAMIVAALLMAATIAFGQSKVVGTYLPAPEGWFDKVTFNEDGTVDFVFQGGASEHMKYTATGDTVTIVIPDGKPEPLKITPDDCLEGDYLWGKYCKAGHSAQEAPRSDTQVQQDPFVGTWKLNVASSKSGVGGTTQPPRTMMRTVVAQGSGYKISYEGEGPGGSRIAYSYVTNFDGKDVPISGMGQPDGADTISVTRDARTATETFKKAGKVVSKALGALSSNGKGYAVSSNGYPSPGSLFTSYQKQ